MDKKLIGSNIKLYQDFPILVPYIADFENNGRNILYRTTTDHRILRLIDHDIGLSNRTQRIPTRFQPIQAIIITYDNIPLHRDHTKRFSYQIILASDWDNTYAIFNYGRLDGDSGDIGFTDPERYSTKRFLSPLADKRILRRTTNINGGPLGKHIYKLSNSC